MQLTRIVIRFQRPGQRRIREKQEEMSREEKAGGKGRREETGGRRKEEGEEGGRRKEEG